MIGQNNKVATLSMGMCMLMTSLSWMYMRIPQYYERIMMNTDLASWLLSGYIIAEVSMVIVAGVLVDRIGPKNVLLAGMAFFIGGALGLCLAGDIRMMIFYRIIEGIGAGFVFTVAVAFIPKAMLKSERLDPHKLMTLTFSVGSMFGTALGYYFIITVGEWRVFIVISAVIMAVFGTLAYLTLPEVPRNYVRDIPGMFLTISAIAAIMTYSQMVNNNFELVSFESLAFVELCIILFAALIFVEKRSKNPLLPRGIGRTNLGLLAGMFLAGFCGIGMLQFLIMCIMVTYKFSLYKASAMLLCLIAGGATTSILGVHYIYKIGIRPMALISPVLLFIAFFTGYFIFTKGIVGAGVTLFIMGLGFGFIITEMLISIQAVSLRKDSGAYTGMITTIRFVGIILGMSVYNYLIIDPVSKYVKGLGQTDVLDLYEWIINHLYEHLDNLLAMFQNSIHTCCIIAGITIISVFIVTYFLVGKDDIDAPESNGPISGCMETPQVTDTADVGKGELSETADMSQPAADENK